MKAKLQRFIRAEHFACPLCHNPLFLEASSLRCSCRHSFDLSKFGYVNLAPWAKQSKNYDRENFLSRQFILEAGFYQHILAKLLRIAEEHPEHKTMLDVGCGEGYYSRQIAEVLTGRELYAFDLSRDSVQLAAKHDRSLSVRWFVGDLARLPIQSESMDLVFDIFSPANYQEFQRVLRRQGLLVKVVPDQEHLQEIRLLAAGQLQQESYSNQQILQHLAERFEILDTRSVSAVFPLSEHEKEALLAMTPLLFHVDRKQLDWSTLKQITIAATVVIAKKRKN